jgi:hypothetical protein
MRLYEEGYEVVLNALGNTHTTELLRVARRIPDGAWDSIFGVGSTLDGFRQQVRAPDDSLTEVVRIVEQFAGVYNDNWAARPRSWMFLKSIPGGARQQIHRDFLDQETMNATDAALPGIVLIALQDNTRLATYGWNNRRALKEQEKIINLARGDMFICRGDMIHCGMDYDQPNIRLHCYLDVVQEGVSFVDNVTQLCRFQSFACRLCGEEFDTSAERRLHQRSCRLWTCRACKLIYATANGLKSHRRLKHGYKSV